MDLPSAVEYDTKSGYHECYLRVETSLEKIFDKWARLLSRKPWIFILAAICICAATATGAYYVSFNNNPSEIWVPLDSPAVDHRDTVEDYYGDPVKRFQIYITSASDNEKDLLSNTPFEQFYEFDKLFKQLSDSDIDYYKICERTSNDHTCVQREYPLAFWYDADSSVSFNDNTPYQVAYRIQSGRGSSPAYESFDPHYIPVKHMFSGRLPEEARIESDGSNDIYYFEAIQYEYSVQYDNDDFDDISDWEDKLDDLIETFNDQNVVIQVAKYSLSAVEKILWEQISLDIGLYIGAIGFIFVYGIFIIGRCNPVLCRLPLSIGMFLCYMMTLGTALFFPCYFGMELSTSNAGYSFLLALQSLLYCSYLVRSTEAVKIKSDEEVNLRHKFAEAIKKPSVSLFRTTIISLIAWAAGTSSEFLAVRYFCITGIVATFFGFIYVMTFFLGALFYDFLRVIKNRGDLCGACRCRANGPVFCGGCCVMDGLADKKTPLFEVFLVRTIVPAVMNFWTKSILILLFFLLSFTGIIGIFLIRHEFDIDWLIDENDDSIEDAIDIQDEYFGDRGSYFGMYIEDTDFSSLTTQQSMLDLEDAMKECYFCEESWIQEDTIFSFYSSFKAWVGAEQCLLDENVMTLDEDGLIPQDNFYPCLNEWMKTPLFSPYENDIILKNGKITIARFTARLKYIDKQGDGIELKEDLRYLANRFGPGDTFAYNENFPYYEQFEEIFHQTLIFVGCTILIAGGVTYLTTYLIFPSLLVMVNTLGMMLALIGAMWYIGVSFNIVAVLHIYMITIAAVEFTSHITHAYCSASGSKQQRLEAIFKLNGSSIVHVCIAVLFSLVIFFSPTLTYIFHVFGLVWGAAMVIVFVDCFFCLPAMLSVVGPYDTENPKINGKIMDEFQLNEQADNSQNKENQHFSPETLKGAPDHIVSQDARYVGNEENVLLDDLVAEGMIRPVVGQDLISQDLENQA